MRESLNLQKGDLKEEHVAGFSQIALKFKPICHDLKT